MKWMKIGSEVTDIDLKFRHDVADWVGIPLPDVCEFTVTQIVALPLPDCDPVVLKA